MNNFFKRYQIWLKTSLKDYLARILTKFDDKLAINLALSINWNEKDVAFVNSCNLSSILVTSLSIGTTKVMHFSVFYPNQVNFPLNSSTNTFMINR